MSPILVKKIFRRGSHITKIVKSAIFVVEKPLKMCPADLRKFKTKKQKQKNVESAFFEGEKSVS